MPCPFDKLPEGSKTSRGWLNQYGLRRQNGVATALSDNRRPSVVSARSGKRCRRYALPPQSKFGIGLPRPLDKLPGGFDASRNWRELYGLHRQKITGADYRPPTPLWNPQKISI
jgi:hypothetical protein